VVVEVAGVVSIQECDSASTIYSTETIPTLLNV